MNASKCGLISGDTGDGGHRGPKGKLQRLKLPFLTLVIYSERFSNPVVSLLGDAGLQGVAGPAGEKGAKGSMGESLDCQTHKINKTYRFNK